MGQRVIGGQVTCVVLSFAPEATPCALPIAGQHLTAEVSGGVVFRAVHCTEKLGNCVRARPAPYIFDP